MNTIKIISIVATFLSFNLFAQGSAPGPGSGPVGHHGHKGPPPQALQACKNLKSGAACSFTSPHGDVVTGSCFAPNANLSLACRPANMPDMREGMPPPPEGQPGGGPQSDTK